MAIDLGTDIRVSADTNDADDLMSEVSGVALVAQDTRLRLLTGSVNGIGGEAYGFNIRGLLGMSTSALAGIQPKIVAVVRRDERIRGNPTVIITESTALQLRTVSIAISARTALGPFRLVFTLAQTTLGDTLAILETV